MANLYGPTSIRYPDGRPASGEDVEVRTQGGSLAVLWANAAETIPLPNPIILDELGNLAFYTEPGFYNIVVNGAPLPIQVLGEGGAGGEHYIHRQDTPSSTWTVEHNLGIPRLPLVTLDSAPGELCWVEYNIVNPNTMTLVFDNAVTGNAYL